MLEITELDVDGSSNGFGRRAVADPTSFAIPVGAKETQQRVSTKLREKISSLEMESFSLQTRAELHRTSAESGAPGVRRGVSEESTFSLPHHQQQQQKQPAHAQPHAHAHEQHFDASSAEPVVSVRKRPVFSGTPNASRVAEMLQRAGMLQQ